jgi:hypothetical protein
VPIRYVALPSQEVAALRRGAPDAYGQPAARAVATGSGEPCRHCLGFVPTGRPMPILAHRPFPRPQPHAETGPIFLGGDACAPFAGAAPAIFDGAPDYPVKGCSPDDRIVYATGRVVPTAGVEAYAEALPQDGRVAYVHVRSARNDCRQLRIERAAA